MIYVEAPTPYQPAPGDGPSLFLAGGITACPDWQSAARTLLTNAPIVVLNPRRRHYNPAHGDTPDQQVAWEYHHMHLADLTLFWFPRCDPRLTVQPITLLELGTALAETHLQGRRITIGADPSYPRRHDLQLQLRHAAPTMNLHHTLNATVSDALHTLNLAAPG